MKRLLLSLLLLANISAIAQPFGNEWVNYSQPYFKFPIASEGLVSISFDSLSTTLASHGFALASIDPRNIQVFAEGVEQHIFIEGEADGSFDQGDRIELYVHGATGFFDDGIYDDPANNANPYYSLFNDTLFYFLTWNNSLNNARTTSEIDVDYNSFTASPYILREEVDELHDTYYPGEVYPAISYTPGPGFTGGNGIFGYYFDGGFIDSFWNLNTIHKTNSGPDAEVEISVVGLSNDNTDLNIAFAGMSVDTVVHGFRGEKWNFTVATSTLGNSTTNFTFDVLNSPVNYQFRAAVGYIKIKYPLIPNLGNIPERGFIVPDNPNFPSQNKSRIDLGGITIADPVVYDQTGNRRIPVVGSGGNYHFLIPDIGTEKRCYIHTGNPSLQAQVGVMHGAGRNGSPYFTDLSALDPSTEFFAITPKPFFAEGAAYASYRTTTGQTAVALDVDELYAQFGNGTPKHPLGIRNFARWAVANLNAPKHIFLIGKSVTYTQARTDPALYAQIMIPSIGDPPVDLMYTAFLENGGLTEEPSLAIGRLAASSPQQVSSYLQKVMEYEALGPELWKKKGLHFSGGGSVTEIVSIRNMLDSYKAFFEDTLLGGYVETFQKTSSEPFQITQVDSITELINTGVQLVNFFGHGSSVGFDVSIDHPSVFTNNDGHYPTMLGLSCFAGDIHQPVGVGSMSENWVLEPDGGALAFIATVGPGKRSYLNNYFRKWYKNLSVDVHGKSIGQVMKKTIADNTQLSNPITTYHNLGNTLHGDPSLIITEATLPDLKTSISEIYTTPVELSTVLDSFRLNVIMTNLGMAFSDSFFIEISYTLPNGVLDTLVSVIHEPVYYQDTLSIYLQIDPFDGVGLNTICVSLDNTLIVDELSEANNNVCIQPLVISPDIVPIYPFEFAVVPDQGITLKASTGNPFAEVKTYRLEIDTTDLFNSPLLQNTTVTQGGGVVEWTPSLLVNMPDSTVYFWRASLDSATYGEYTWRETSFQYIVDKYGWGQAHFYQYKKDQFDLLQYDRPQREFDFITVAKQIQLNNFGSPTNLTEAEAINYHIDNGLEEYLGCTGGWVFSGQILTAIIDPCDLTAWQTPGIDPFGVFLEGNGAQGQLEPCRQRPESWYQWLAGDPTSMNSMVNFLENVVPDSHYVAMLTWLDVDLSSFNPSWLAPFQAMGATSIDTIAHVPYIFFGKKGDPSWVVEEFGSDISDHIQLTTDMVGCWNVGQITTPLIGPTNNWNSLHFKLFAQENPTVDSFAVNVIGVTPGGAEETIITGLSDWTTDIPDLFNQIDAAQYPRLRLNAYLEDDSLSSTPSQLYRWQVLFDGVPEAALDQNIGFAWSGDTLTEGQSMMFSTAITNISDFDMDSLLVRYWIIDEDNNRVDIPYSRQAPLLAGDVLLDTVFYNPIGLTGISAFWVEVNPVPTGQNIGYDQIEQYHFNNLGSLKFTAFGDNINPIMDVTFDDVHILDGDIVSAKPLISIEVDDESEFNLLTDTGDVQVFLTSPNSSQIQRIWFNNGQTMQFYPGEAPDNKARIEFPADFPIDGVYELLVQGYDRSHNASGDQFYRISFEVVNRSTITEIMNWPNPFSTRTHFVFTLTGSTPPTFFKIQILTISGKVVREIMLDELGPINIGRNITQYAWDGKDTYGDQLANGVYLYRVITRIDDDIIEHRDSGADQWIDHEFGKMMLIR